MFWGSLQYHQAIQKPFSYFGRIGHHYSVFSWGNVFSMVGDIQSPISLYTRLDENSNRGPFKLTGLLESSGTQGTTEDKDLGLGSKDLMDCPDR